MFLFDTDIITNIFKKKPSRNLIQRLRNLDRDSQHITTITIGEIVYGAIKSSRPEFHLQNLNALILPSVNILPFDSKAAFEYGKIRAGLERRGEIISHTDMQIAAIALANDFVLVTGNASHFRRVENLRIENWL